MQEVVLIYPTPEGSQEIALEGEKLSFGRGSEVDFRFEDDGLSRLHATIYRDRDYVWIVDENSTNGTFVNGEGVSSNGTPLKNGDAIKIGHYTTLQVRIAVQAVLQKKVSSRMDSAKNNAGFSSINPSYFLPLAVIGIAVLVITASAVFIGVTTGSESKDNVVKKTDEYNTPLFPENDNDGSNKKALTPMQRNENSNSVQIVENNTNLNLTEEDNHVTEKTLPNGKKYQEMGDIEKRQYIALKAEKVAQMIGNRSGESIPPEAIDKIKRFLEAYLSRIRSNKIDDCTPQGWLSSDLVSVLERASENAPVIIRSFNEQGMDGQIGIYLAMIESEHCHCLQSGTGPLGIFQFTFLTAKGFFKPNDEVRKGSSPANPDIRCKLEPAAQGSARYMKYLTGYFGTGPSSVPLAIGSYNSGEGDGFKNLKAALQADKSQDRNFWTLVANSEKLSKQFQLENFKYVPKFFAAAIIGENPQDFGLKLQKVSTYTK